MQGEVSYREPDDQSSFASDLESGTGAPTTAASSSSSSSKKAVLFTSILLFIAACTLLVYVGKDRPPVEYDSNLPTAPNESNNNRTRIERAERVEGRVKTGGLFSGQLTDVRNPKIESRYTGSNKLKSPGIYLPIEEDPTTTESPGETTESTDITETPDQTTFSDTTDMTTIEDSSTPIIGMVTPTLDESFFGLDANTSTPRAENQNTNMPLEPSTTTSSTTSDSTTTERTFTTRKTTAKMTATTRVTTQRTSKPTTTKSPIGRTTFTTENYNGYYIPLPPRPKPSKPRRPKNWYEYYLRKGHFPLCAAILAFFHTLLGGY